MEPTFLVIGAQKSGTTWLAEMLRQHDQIFIPRAKELHYYNDRTRRSFGRDWYVSNFDDAPPTAVAVGEATPNYLWTTASPLERETHNVPENIPEAIASDFADLRFVVLLRDPVERAVSAFHHMVRSRYVKPSARILDVAHLFGIESAGWYAQNLRDWFAVWPRDRFLVLLYEEAVRGDKRTALDDVCEFLGVPPLPSDVPLDEVLNRSAGGLYLRTNWRSPLVARGVRRIWRGFENLDLFPVRVTADEWAQLRGRFRGEVERLADVLDRDLSVWPTARG